MNRSAKIRFLPVLAVGLLLGGVFLVGAGGQEKPTVKAKKTQEEPKDTISAEASHKPVKKGTSAMSREKMVLSSTAFADGEVIPVKYTCDGEDLSPPLTWESVPEGTRAFALICDDPDAPVGTWDHWVLFNLSGDLRGLPEGLTPKTELAEEIGHGLNSWKRIGYGGPCPPPGKPHRYFFRLYALSAPVDLKEKATKAEVLKSIELSVLASATLMGTYGR
jgi:Raf kinase inhibitor-like YbhB/YbcL family protein